MGKVFKACSKNDNGLYALKVLPRRSMWHVRLARRQVSSFGQFSHPAVVPFVDVGTSGGLHYLVWPLVEGQTLKNLIQQQGVVPADHAANIGLQIAQGMNIAHQNNIFHGLLKPSNVMLGSDGQARLLDFGIGSLLVENEGESLVDTMSTANTLTSGLDCASPESVMDPSNRTPAGDQYSLGCTLYFALTGRAPFPQGTAVEKMMAHQTRQPQSIPDFAPETPEGLVQVVSRLMARTPEDRFSGMDEVVEALEPFIGELAQTTAQQPAADAAVGFKPRSSIIVAGNDVGSTPKAPGRSFGPPPQTPSPARFVNGFSPPSASGKQSPLPAEAPDDPPPLPSRAGISTHDIIATGPYSQPAPSAASPTAIRASRYALPARGSIKPTAQETAGEDDVPPTQAGNPEAPDEGLHAESSRLSAAWTDRAPDKHPQPAFRMVGIISAALLLAMLVFMGTKILILQ